MFTGKVKSAGFSLLEVTLSAALSLLFLLILYQTLIAAGRYQENANTKIALQHQLLKAVRKVGSELLESNRYAIAADPNQQAVVFPNPRDREGRASFDGAGRLLWQRKVCIYQGADAQGEALFEKNLYLDPAAADPPPPPLIPALRDNPQLTPVVLARSISLFAPKESEDGTIEFTLRAELKLQHHRYSVEIDEKALPRN